ncbi:MAG: hypothetical protein ACXQTS_05015, partial [Candidatus Methanospirareceae archaeon]
KVLVYRFKVKNKGKTAAENVRGTVEFPEKEGFTKERRICWYEGNTASLTINANDHSYLDVYGVVLDEPNTICFPTEGGWKKLSEGSKVRLEKDLKIKIRVTAGNAKPIYKEYTILGDIRLRGDDCENDI